MGSSSSCVSPTLGRPSVLWPRSSPLAPGLGSGPGLESPWTCRCALTVRCALMDHVPPSHAGGGAVARGKLVWEAARQPVDTREADPPAPAPWSRFTCCRKRGVKQVAGVTHCLHSSNSPILHLSRRGPRVWWSCVCDPVAFPGTAMGQVGSGTAAEESGLPLIPSVANTAPCQRPQVICVIVCAVGG